MSSVRGPQVSHRELNLAVGKLPPVLDDRREVSLRELIKDFAGFATSFLDWQLEYLRRLHRGHPGCQILPATLADSAAACALHKRWFLDPAGLPRKPAASLDPARMSVPTYA
jgi:hypothetical protein